METHRFGLKQLPGLGCRLEHIAKVRQSHQPYRMFHSLVAADMERRPAGVGNPTVFGGEIVIEEEVMNGTGKWNVHVTPVMDMADFRLAEAIFPRCEAVRVHGNPRPG